MALKPILMSDQDKQKWTEPLTDFYRNKGMPESELEKTIDKVFAEVQVGWNRAPNDIDTRIKMKTGFQWKSHENLIPKKREIEEAAAQSEEESSVEESIQKHMSKTEKAWWAERIQIYTQDFDFNESSDKPLLDQLLVEELIQRRIFRMQIRDPKKSFSKQLSDGLKRVLDVQAKLGITREQRSGILSKIDGNVAQLSVDLDNKLAKMKELKEADSKEEAYYINLKSQKPPINILPPVTKIEALLKVDGKVSANLESNKISEITEEVAKEIMDAKEEKKELKARELPSGVNVSR